MPFSIKGGDFDVMLEKIVQSDRRALYIAEIGLNHNGNTDTARLLISAAARAGADFVKFQTFVPELLSSPYTADLLATGQESKKNSDTIDFFRRFVFSREEYSGLKSFAEGLRVNFFSSVFDSESLELLEGVGVSLYKLASSEVTNHRLIQAVAETGKPAILSTGMSSEDEIGRAVGLFKRTSGAELILMHCVSLYPTLPDQVNLARVRGLAKRFGLPVGFSDHTKGTAAPVVAAACGARIFEKHFTIDRLHDCPDKDISCTPEEFAGMIDSVEDAIRMIGSDALSSGAAESAAALAGRRSLYARRFIPKGKTLDYDDLVALRPGVGIPAYEMTEIVGKRTAADIPEHFLLRREHLQDR
jgi:N,N'-diacetyllegionaminate synthase